MNTKQELAEVAQQIYWHLEHGKMFEAVELLRKVINDNQRGLDLDELAREKLFNIDPNDCN